MKQFAINELISRGYKVYVGKTWKDEIDFIAELNGKIIYIQAAYLLTDEKTIEREFGAYEKLLIIIPNML